MGSPWVGGPWGVGWKPWVTHGLPMNSTRVTRWCTTGVAHRWPMGSRWICGRQPANNPWIAHEIPVKCETVPVQTTKNVHRRPAPSLSRQSQPRSLRQPRSRLTFSPSFILSPSRGVDPAQDRDPTPTPASGAARAPAQSQSKAQASPTSSPTRLQPQP